MTTPDPPVLRLTLPGNLGNRMIAYMAALKLAILVPGCRIANVSLPEWGIDHPDIASPGPVLRIGPWEPFDLFALAAALNQGQVRRVEWSGYGQRMENFLPPKAYAPVFPAIRPPVPAFGADHLVCPVRAGDILDGTYGHYPLTPVEFYAALIARTGLTPVFMGQTAPNTYTDRLRAAFPQAVFLDSFGPTGDFALIRSAANIAVGVSTFAWLAAWLSQADRVFMAVSGLFNPMQQRQVNLLPFGDPRYHFWLFPINYAALLDQHAAVHRRMMPYCREMTHTALQRQLDQAPRFARALDPLLAAFDEAFYLGRYPDVADAVAQARLASGRAHYQSYGFGEYREPFFLHGPWYADHYPMAAFEVAQGDYADLHHHYVAIGRYRGYRPAP